MFEQDRRNDGSDERSDDEHPRICEDDPIPVVYSVEDLHADGQSWVESLRSEGESLLGGWAVRSSDVQSRNDAHIDPERIVQEGGIFAGDDKDEEGEHERAEDLPTEFLEHLPDADALNDRCCDVVDEDPC